MSLSRRRFLHTGIAAGALAMATEDPTAKASTLNAWEVTRGTPDAVQVE